MGAIAAGVSFVVVNIENPNVPTTSAFIGDNVTIGSPNKPVQNITVEAKPKYAVDTNVFGLSGGVGAASVNFSRANVRPETHATIGKTNLYSSGKVRVSAVPTIDAEVTGTGVAAGGIGAGVMLANLEVGRGNGIDEVQAGFDDGANVHAQSVVIEANSLDHLDVQSVAGAGGAIGATWAKSTLKSDQSTLAHVGSAASNTTTSVNVDTFVMQARHEQDIDSKADAVTVALAAGSGAGLENTLTGRAKALVGKATVDAKSIIINADNTIDKDRYGSGDGVNLATVTVSGGSISGLESKTSIGTVANPTLALVDIKPGATLRSRGTADKPGTLSIDAGNAIDAVDRTNSEEYALGVGVTLATGSIDVQSRSMVNLDGAMLENKYGTINIATHADSQSTTSTDVNAASGVSSQISSNAVAKTNANQKINLNNAELIGKEVRLYAGQDKGKSSNLILNSAVAQGFVAAAFPNLIAPNAVSEIVEKNEINILGTTTVEAFGDIELITREGVGKDERAFAGGNVFSLSALPINIDANTSQFVDSDNDVNIDSTSKLTAGIASYASIHIVPVSLDNQPYKVGNQDVTLNAELDESAKDKLGIPASMDYHYAPINLGELTFDFYSGFVVQPIAGAAPGAVLNHHYQFLPSSINGATPIVPHLENYADTSRWKDLGVLSQSQLDNLAANAQSIYKSNILLDLKAQLAGKFAIVKPVDLDGARLVYRNVGNLLYGQHQQLKQWILEHQGDPEAVARYQVQLEEVEALMLELGLASLLNPGQPQLSLNGSLNSLFVEVPSLVASPGSVFIEASGLPVSLVQKYQPMVGSKVLNAHAGANIDIYNKSPFSMVSAGALAEDNQRVATDENGNFVVLEPGNIYVNNSPLTSNNSAGIGAINITQNDLGPLSSYGLNNLPIPLPNLDQDLYINGDVINEAGNIRIENAEGSIFVNGEVRGASVEIIAARDFNLNTEGWYHSNRDPRQLIDYNKYRETLFNEAQALRGLTGNDEWTNLINPALVFDDPANVDDDATTLAEAIALDESRILAQGDIVITARYLNVNGLIQSGSDEIQFKVDNSFAPPTVTTNFLTADGKQLLPGLSFGAAGVPIDGYWDATRQAFVIEEIEPEGGRIRIAGQILSTGNGRLKVATGNPSVDIDNNSPYLVILEGIDTTKPREGFIEVTDTHGPNPTRIQYKFVAAANKIEEKRFNGVEVPTDKIGDGVDNDQDGDLDDGQIGRIIYTQSMPTIMHGFNDTIQYLPDPNTHYVWSEGKSGIQQTVSEYIENNDWYTYAFFFIDFDQSNLVGQYTSFLDEKLMVTSETLEEEGVNAPTYSTDQAYSIKYERHGDPRVRLKPQSSLVLHPLPTGFDFSTFPPTLLFEPNTHVYRYIGDAEISLELSEADYSDPALWEISEFDPTTFQIDPASDKFFSSFKNDYTLVKGPEDIGNNKKRTVTIRERGVRDMYTHTLKADYPIGIQFSKSPALPKISVDSKGGILILGNIQSPAGGTIDLTSIAGSIESNTGVAIYGASPTVTALGDVTLSIEGNKGALGVNAGGDIQLTAISLDNVSSSFVIGTVNSLSGDVVINAKDGISNKDSSSLLAGNRLDLKATEGGIGTTNSPLKVKAGSNVNGGLTALAEGDILIQQTTGDLLLVRPIRSNAASVESTTGDVTLIAATGSILDGDNEFKKKAASTTPSILTTNFLNNGITKGIWTAASTKYPVSAGLVKFLYPHQNLLGQTPPTEMTERINVRGNKVTLSATSVAQEIGHVGDAIIINNPKNFSALSEEQQSILASANATDVVGVAYGLYKFLGSDASNVDLTRENFSDASRWLKLNTHFATGLARSGESSQLLQAGDRVRVENDVDHYGVYEYFGPTEVLNLLQINYLDRTRWTKLTGDAATDDGPVNLANGMIIVNKFVVDSLILRPIQDVNVDAQTHIRSTASYRTALESAAEMRILRIESGDDMFLRSRTDVIDLGERESAAAIATGGEAVISALGKVYSPSEDSALRTQITPSGSLRVLASGSVNVRQVGADTALSGVPVAINDLFIDRIEAEGEVHIVVDEGNMRINYITSKSAIDLAAQNAILDAFPAHKGIYVNIYTPATAAPGHVTLTASSIGTSQAPLTLDLQSGDLVTQTSGNQWIQAVSDLVASNLVSTGGNIVVHASNRVLVGLIEALNGNVTINASGSILDFDGDGDADINAISIALYSSAGSIGQLGNDLEVDTANNAASQLVAMANGDVVVQETSGRLNVQQAVSQGQGNVRLSNRESTLSGEDIYGLVGGLIQAASGDISIQSADNISMLAAVSGQNVSFQADTHSADAAGANVSISGAVTSELAEITTGDDADTVVVAAALVTGFVIRTKKGNDDVTGGAGDDLIFGDEVATSYEAEMVMTTWMRDWVLVTNCLVKVATTL